MRYDEVLARLASLPVHLPAPADALRPTRLWRGGTLHPSEFIPGTATQPRAAAVLVLVVPSDDGEARVILTERVDRGGHHSGEVSFPGGVAEPEDEDAVATALREAAEEVGLDPRRAGVRIIGTLDTFHINVSGFDVTPVLAVAERRPELVPSPEEVARIIEAPIRGFLRDAPIEVFERQVAEWTLRFGAYRVEDVVVWGATARILSQFGALLGDAPEDGGSPRGSATGGSATGGSAAGGSAAGGSAAGGSAAGGSAAGGSAMAANPTGAPPPDRPRPGPEDGQPGVQSHGPRPGPRPAR